MEVRRRTPWTAPAEEHGANQGNRRMGWCGRPEEGVGAVGGHPADIYSVWSTRPEPGREGLAPARKNTGTTPRSVSRARTRRGTGAGRTKPLYKYQY